MCIKITEYFSRHYNTMASNERLLRGKKGKKKTGGGSTEKVVATSTRSQKTTQSACKSVNMTSRSAMKTGREMGERTMTMANLNDEFFRLIGKSLTQNVWYHGLMPRQDCEDLLKQDGDFLVRKTTVGKAPTYCISVHHKGECKHVPVHFVNNSWQLKEHCKPTLAELIDFVVECKKPIVPSQAVLRKAIPRPEYYILHDNVTVTKKLGSGAFGEVYTGLLKRKLTGQEGEEEVKVAVKKIKGAVTKKQLSEFVKEAKLMRRFDHPNIVRLYGIAPQEEPIMIVLEMAEGGSLKGYCENNPSVPDSQLLAWATDGVRGMAYLSGRAVIHRDLAARNCLLGGKKELKISDFGLSIADQSQVKLDKLKSMPIKWLAPETLSKGVFSTKTDVWSYGVLLWELFSRCKSDPFPGENNQKARNKILSGKDPMDPPSGCPEIGVTSMKLCFTQDPEKRPDFTYLLKLFAPNEEPPKPLQPWETYID